MRPPPKIEDILFLVPLALLSLVLGVVQVHNGIMNGMIQRKIAVAWQRGERVYVSGAAAKRAGVFIAMVGFVFIAGAALAALLFLHGLRSH
jgi:hypothetical protein